MGNDLCQNHIVNNAEEQKGNQDLVQFNWSVFSSFKTVLNLECSIFAHSLHYGDIKMIGHMLTF